MGINRNIGIKIGKFDDVEQLFMLDKQGNLTGIEGLYITATEIENRPLTDFRPVFVLDLPKPHEFLEALESVLPAFVTDFSATNVQRIKALYNQINSQISIPRIKEPEVGEEITARHMELTGAAERLKEKPCDMIRARGRIGASWYDFDCKTWRFWADLEEPQLAQVAE